MNNLELVAYAQGFVSFLLRNKSLIATDVKDIILFGSAVRGEAGKESDIDIFIDVQNRTATKEVEKIAKQSLKDFYSSNIFEQWKLRGIGNEIKIKVGILKEWALRRSIISEGISLYGKYKELPDKLNQFSLFAFEPVKNITKRNRIIRELFGRRERNFQSEGLIKKISGKRLGSTVFFVPAVEASYVIKLLGREKARYKIFEFWSDAV